MEEGERRLDINRNALYKLLHNARLCLNIVWSVKICLQKNCWKCSDYGKEIQSHSYKQQDETMKSIFDLFKRRFKKWYQPDAEMVKMLQALAMTEEQEICCDDVFAVLDEFVEAVHRGENVLLLMPLVRQHLDMCPNCREEYEALLRMLQPAFA